MIDDKTLPHQPCPLCASTAVRWRDRRWYDLLRTWLRYGFELVPSGMAGGGVRRRARPFAEVRRYTQAEMLEAKTGMRTPYRFWRCPDCRNSGEIWTAPSRARRAPRVDDRTKPPA